VLFPGRQRAGTTGLECCLLTRFPGLFGSLIPNAHSRGRGLASSSRCIQP